MQSGFTKEELNVFADDTKTLLAVLSDTGVLKKMNAQWSEQFSIGSLTDTSLFDLVLEDDRDGLKEAFRYLVTGNNIAEHRFRCVTEHKIILAFKAELSYKEGEIYFKGINLTREEKRYNSLKQVSELLKAGRWDHNPISHESKWSKECYEILNIEIDQKLNSDSVKSLLAVSEQNQYQVFIDELYHKRHPSQYIGQIITRIEEKKWIKIVAKPIIHLDEIISIEGVIVDVTEQRTLINDLQESNELKHLALKGIKSAQFYIDRVNKTATFGPEFRKLMGMVSDLQDTHEDAVKKYVYKDDWEKAFTRHAEELQKRGNFYFNEYRLVHADGEVNHYEVYGWKRRNEEGEVVQLIGNYINVEEKFAARLETKSYLKRLESIVNNGYLYTYLLDTEGYILLTDQASVTIIQNEFNVNPLKQRVLFKDIAPNSMHEGFDASFKKVLEGSMIRKEIERTLMSGANLWLDVMYRPILNDEGEVIFVVIYCMDVTERKKAELVSREARNQSEQLNELKLNILSTLSHEIRTPMNGILGASALFQKTKLSKEQIQLLEILEKSGGRLMSTLSGLVNLGMLKSDKSTLAIRPFSLYDIVNLSFDKHIHMSESKGVEMSLLLPEKDVKVIVNSEMLTVSIDSLINNAIKYTSQGSIKVVCKVLQSRKQVQIRISDTGIGIDDTNLVKIFEDFFQESTGLDRKYEGTGIGLSITKRYIELMGGSISVISKPNEGSIFTIRIPME